MKGPIQSVTGNIQITSRYLSFPSSRQERYLKEVTIGFRPYSQDREGWDHDYCEFCGAKFMEPGTPHTLHEGYTTEDSHRWICTQCLEDFRSMFERTVAR